MLKECAKCHKYLDVNEFIPRKERNDRPHSYCNECRLENVRRVAANRKAKHLMLQQYKRTLGCILCGFSEPCALDFHHLGDETKTDNISQMLTYHASLIEIVEEVRKCVIICSNHHRMLHVGLITKLDIPTNYHRHADTLLAELKNKKLTRQEYIESRSTCRCGNKKHYTSALCQNCAAKEHEKITWPSNDILIQMIHDTSRLATARKLGVSERAVRKRIKNHSLVV